MTDWKRLEFGTPVTTPSGEGLYVNRDGDGPDHWDGYHWVLLKKWPRQQHKFHWSVIAVKQTIESTLCGDVNGSILGS